MSKMDFEHKGHTGRLNNRMTHFVAGDLVQWPRPSVAGHVILLNIGHRHVVVRPLAWAGVGQLD